MERKYIIGLVVLAIVVALVIMISLGLLVFKVKGFSNLRFMLGKSKLDKLIDKINNYLNPR